MASVIYLDTHVVAWLYAGELNLLPSGVRSLLESEDLVISPIVEFELQYLYELKRTAEPGNAVVEALEREIGLSRCALPFEQVVAAAMIHSWTCDPFDRLIVGQASVRRSRLLTRDEEIRQHYSEAVWLA